MESVMSEALGLIYTAVDQVNSQISRGPKIAKDPETSLLAANSGIDSLTLVNLVVALEQVVFDKYGKTVVIADESVFSSPNNPFRTLRTLADHLDTLLK
jgi:acyl carrier protein